MCSYVIKVDIYPIVNAFCCVYSTEYQQMPSHLGSETTEEVKPGNERVIYINSPQPSKYCNNKIRSVYVQYW